MSDSPIFPPSAPTGYLSQAAKQTFLVVVSVAGAGYFLMQSILPSLIMFGFFTVPLTQSISSLKVQQLDQVVYWDDRVWTIADGVNMQRMTETTLLQGFVPFAKGGENAEADGEAAEEYKFDFAGATRAHLLPADDRLWIISPANVAYLQDGEVTTLDVLSLKEISRPFVYQGKPAVIEQNGTAFSLKTLTDEGWMLDRNLVVTGQDFPWASASMLLPIMTGDDVDLFALQGGAVYHCADLIAQNDRLAAEQANQAKATPEEKEKPTDGAETVAPEATPSKDDVGTPTTPNSVVPTTPTTPNTPMVEWNLVALTGLTAESVVAIDGKPTVFAREVSNGLQQKIVGLQETDNDWGSFFSYEAGFVIQFGGCDLPEEGRFLLATAGMPGTVNMLDVQDGQVVDQSRHGKGMEFLDNIGTMYLIIFATMLVTGLIFVAVIDWSFKRYRDSYFRFPAGSVEYASMARRASALAIDSLIGYLPMLPLIGWIVWAGNLESLLDPKTLLILLIFGMGFMTWGLMLFVAVSFLEGRFGFSPGKWIMGIRVLGTDLNPAGFGHALVRNLLLVVDWMFNGLIGGLLVALTDKRQRLGDMAAGTVVLRDPTQSSRQ